MVPTRRPRENRTRYVVLGMLTTGALTGYGLRQRIAGSVGHFWQESYGQLYPTLRQLVAEGLVEARATRGGPGRRGMTYHLTARGRAALAAWVAVPPVPEPRRNELLLKVFFAGAVPPEVTARNLEGVAATLRAQRAELEAIARRMDAPHDRHPDERFWRLTLDFGRDILDGTLAWLDHARAVIRPRRRRAPMAQAAGARGRRGRRPGRSP